MGFEAVEDAPDGEDRWIAVLTPDGNTRLVLSKRGDHPPRAAAELPSSNVMFYADDVEATYRELTERGVVFAIPLRARPDVGRRR